MFLPVTAQSFMINLSSAFPFIFSIASYFSLVERYSTRFAMSSDSGGNGGGGGVNVSW